MLASEQQWVHDLKVLLAVWVLCETVRTDILLHQTLVISAEMVQVCTYFPTLLWCAGCHAECGVRASKP